MAEAKRRARRRRLLLALGVAAGGAVAVTQALQSSAGPGGAPSAAATAGAGSGGAALNEGPVLAGGVAPVTGGRVVASVTPDSGKVGTRVRLTQIATAPIDASGNFVLRPDPTSRVLAPTIVEAITSIARQYVDVSGKPLSLAEFRAAPGSGHWIGDGTGGTMVDPKYEVALPSSQGAHR
jgi:hypothetical protein